MSDTKTPGDKTLHVSSSKTLTLKRPVEQGMVRQSFSHGRSKAVVVEKVKRRVVGPGEAKEAPAPTAMAAPAAKAPPAAKAAPGAQAAPAATARSAQPQAPSARPTGMVLRTLSDQERDARASALADAKVREEEDRRRAEEDAKRRAEREARDAREREAAEARKRDED